MTVPEIDKLYPARGYFIRVDHIEAGQVYCTRWRSACLPCFGERVRVSLETWNREMSEATGDQS
jgi:hypothetical protein